MNLIFHFINARKTEEIAPGTEIFKAGEAGSVMYVLLEGAARILVGRRVVEVAGPGAILGEMALIDDQPRSATVVTMSRCRVVAIGSTEFDLLVREKPEFARHVMKVVADRLRRMNAAVEDIKTVTPRPSRLDETVPV